jgi:ParB family chromosome partitioning protein
MVERGKAKSTVGSEWYTPEEIIDLARAVLDKIDLDPATSEIAQKTVRATTRFTKDEDGLTKEWWGNVWLNAPYMPPLMAQFMEKMVSEYTSGHVDQAIMLTHNYTETMWWHLGFKHCSAICFTKGRIPFIDPDGNPGKKPEQGQVFFYFGQNIDRFVAVFEGIGSIAFPHHAVRRREGSEAAAANCRDCR